MADWGARRLADIARLTMGQSPPGSRVTDLDGGLPFLQGNAEFGSRFPKATFQCDDANRRCAPGDSLISVRAPVGAINRADRGYGIGRGLAAVTFDLIDPDFGHHALVERSQDLQRVSQGTTFSAIGQVELAALQFPVPPLEEQRRIAEILDTIDEAIQATERVIQKLMEVKNGLLLNVLDTYFPGSGPLALRASRSAHDCVLLSALLESGEIELGRGKIISSIDIANDPGPYPIYSSSASAAGEFGRSGKFMFDEELITWSVDGGGRPFYRPRHRFSVTNVGGFLRIKVSKHWSYRFVHALMEVQHAQLTFDWSTKAHPSVIRDLYWFPRIYLGEQHQITDRLAAVDVSVRHEKAQMVKLNRLRAGLAVDLLSGRVRTVAA